TAAPVMSAGDTVATLTPDPGLAYGVAYELKVTIDATDASGLPLGAEHLGSFTVVPPTACAGNVVISQVYGGGGNSGAPLTHDFVELHNAGQTPAVLDGWALRYTSATGSTWGNNLALSGVIPPGGYFLVQLASNNNGGVPLPTPDATGAFNMAGTNGKIALVASVGALAMDTCPTGQPI